MHQFYPIYTTSDYATVGNVYPQASSVYTPEMLLESLQTDGRHYTAFESMKNVFSQKVPDGITWEFRLDPKTICTDVLSVSAYVTKGLLVSDIMRELLAGFAVDSIEFVPCKVHHNKETRNYFYLYPREPLMDKHIDITATTFVLLDDTDKNFRMEYRAKNKQDYRQRMNNSHNRQLSTKDGLYLKDFSPADDIIELEHYRQRLFVSAKLHEALRSKGLTGFEFGQPEMIHKT